MPDWESYVLYGGDPMLERVRDVDAEELRQYPSRGLAPSIADKYPELPEAPFVRERPLETGVTTAPSPCRQEP